MKAVRILVAAAAVLAVLALGAVGAPAAPEPFRVMIDPGHGGRDGGAVGRMGTREKDVTLRFARLLRDALEATAGVTVSLTRDGDRAVRLGKRVAMAREANANLFVSVHADSIRLKGVRGASVYTLAEEASDEIARSIAEGQERSDVLAGFDPPEAERETADILLDLLRRETDAFSRNAAKRTVTALRRETRMIGNPHRSANFRVLRAPDVPSILIELGYLSNRGDERLLRDEKWLRAMADALAGAIVTHARETGALAPGGDG